MHIGRVLSRRVAPSYRLHRQSEPIRRHPHDKNAVGTTISSQANTESRPILPNTITTDSTQTQVPGPLNRENKFYTETLEYINEKYIEGVKTDNPYEQLIENNGLSSVETQVAPRFPRAVQALYLKPLRRISKDGVPSCDLQLRSFSARNVEFFSDWALRVAYYLNLPAYGPVPLPNITEKWTVPKSHFIFKKSQENFQRITYRRLIQLKDGHPDNVKLWLAYLRKHQYHGVAMKANVWEWSSLDVAGEMDKRVDAEKSHINEVWKHLGDTKKVQTARKVSELLTESRFKLSGGR